jgi:hypothetical protein
LALQIISDPVLPLLRSDFARHFQKTNQILYLILFTLKVTFWVIVLKQKVAIYLYWSWTVSDYEDIFWNFSQVRGLGFSHVL